MIGVTIYELPRFEGNAHTLPVGDHRLFDLVGFAGRVASIKVPMGLVALVYEHADSGGGYGLSADFLEDHADLSQLNLSDRISYITVFHAERPPGHVWIRNRIVNGGFVAGHWERKRQRAAGIRSCRCCLPADSAARSCATRGNRWRDAGGGSIRSAA